VTSVRQGSDELCVVLAGAASNHGLQHLVNRFAVTGSSADAILQNLPQRRARSHLIRTEPIDFREAAVGENDAHVAIEHGQALDHVVEGGVEMHVLAPQLLLLLLEHQVLLFQACVEALALRYVLMGDDVAAVGKLPAGHVDDAAVS
jgi:hypothetical protein